MRGAQALRQPVELCLRWRGTEFRPPAPHSNPRSAPPRPEACSPPGVQGYDAAPPRVISPESSYTSTSQKHCVGSPCEGAVRHPRPRAGQRMWGPPRAVCAHVPAQPMGTEGRWWRPRDREAEARSRAETGRATLALHCPPGWPTASSPSPQPPPAKGSSVGDRSGQPPGDSRQQTPAPVSPALCPLS